ncbi:FtsJ-domain-containing protein [Lipomyces oligophaga]|uniref:FtsJ-domain-containing protein n=1 Tax=Lipomyces oligophaga TaxID=45792 RepID=UPI0034CF334C
MAKLMMLKSPECLGRIVYKIYGTNLPPNAAEWSAITLISNLRLNQSWTQRRASSSSSRWIRRQRDDKYRKEAEIQGYASRAAFKLLEMNQKYPFLKPGQTVVDLGFAPGSWSQVAIDKTAPGGRVVGIDLLPCAPPKGGCSIQGNFLDPAVIKMLKEVLSDPDTGRPVQQRSDAFNDDGSIKAYIDLERTIEKSATNHHYDREVQVKSLEAAMKDMKIDLGSDPEIAWNTVDVVLSDMCEPWITTFNFWLQTLSRPYIRLMNTSGNTFRDHATSMDLCNAALAFALDTLRPNGSFICKFYSGKEDSLLERKLQKVFRFVKRYKPPASRSESKEQYFIALERFPNISKREVYGDLYEY